VSVAEAQASTDSREFAEWLAYQQIDPSGEDRADLRAAIIACVIANANRDPKSKPFTPSDFMPDFAPKRQPPNDELIRAKLMLFVEAHNGNHRNPRS